MAKDVKDHVDGWVKIATIAGVIAAIVAILGYLGVNLNRSPATSSPPKDVSSSASSATSSPPTQAISSSQSYPSPSLQPLESPGTPHLALDPSSGPAGTLVTATATGFTGGGQVQIFFSGELVGQGNANERGTAKITFSVPSQYANPPPPAPEDITVSASDAEAENADQIFKLT